MALPRTFLFLAASFTVTLVPAAPADPPKPEPDAARITRLIEQLGSESFTEREAATKTLREIGEPALAVLRTAAKTSPDGEVRRRARQLAELLGYERAKRQVKGILGCKLSWLERQWRLAEVGCLGMTKEQVRGLFGEPDLGLMTHGEDVEFYPRCGVCVTFVSNRAHQVDAVVWWRPPPGATK